MPIIVKRLPKYEILYNLPKDTNTIICVGGRGGSKTYEISKFVAFQTAINKKKAIIVRDEKALIKESILSEIWERYNTANANGRLDAECIKNETELKDKKTGETLLYTKGFRASSTQKSANLKGSANVDIAVIEEAEDIRDSNKFNTFADSLRKEGCLIIIMLNTPDLGHWICKRFFTAKQVEDGYYELIPKDIPGIVTIQTSFTDNPYLPAHIVANYNGYGDPSHHLYDIHYYYTAIKGYASTGRKGQIFTKVKPISLSNYLKLPLKEYYGQDFGTASPAALVGVKFDGNTAYCRLINYKPATALELGKLYCTLQFNTTDKIVCDYADAFSLGKLANGWQDLGADDYMKYPSLSTGFFAVPCPPKDLSGHISIMKSMNLFAVEECTELWDEINNYIYAVDKNKNPTDEPVDEWNHALDALRYVIIDQRGYSQQRAY